MKRILLFTFAVTLFASLHGQTPIGKFRSHIPLHRFHSVAVADDYIYAATTNGIMLLEKKTYLDESPAISSWTKVDGLSDVDLVKICYDKTSATLIVCYQNGNLDFIQGDKLYNVSDVKNKQLTGSKSPSHVRIYGDQAYIVYPFGVVVININDRLIEETWFTQGTDTSYIAQDLTLDDTHYYLATNMGIFSIARSNPVPSNFLEWRKEPLGDYNFDNLFAIGGYVYANKNSTLEVNENIKDTIFVHTNGEWMATTQVYDNVMDISGNDQEMAICNQFYVDVFNSNFEHQFKGTWYQDDNSYPYAKEANLDNDNIWIADDNYGLILANRTFFYNKIYNANGPFTTNSFGLCSKNGILAVVPGAHNASFSPSYQYPSVSWFVNNKWYYNAWDFYNYDPNHLTMDFVNVIINPKDETEWYIASWGNGLFKCKNQHIVQHFNASNSALDSTDLGSTFVSGLAYDKKGNLWVTNSQTSHMLKMMEPDGTWHNYNITSGVITGTPQGVAADQVLVDSRNIKWVTFPRDDNFNKYHLIAFNENGTYDNPGDDQFRRVDMNIAARVNSSTVYCVAEDLDGEIWIGTDKGIKVIYYPQKIFEGSANPNNILLEQDGYVSVLLEYEAITAIAVDGANRKWIGTNKAGVFLMSENGQEQLLHFTAEDHPLFSNQINSINIDQLSGEVYFATAKGLVSYRGTATQGYETYEDLPVVPNPVRHDYSGKVAVKGLKTNSLCKITDASGKLVWQGYSDGGQLVWDCRDHYGQRPATGVYYVMASDEEGKEKIVTKFLFIH